MVRKIKYFKKETPIVLPDALESKRENSSYNKLLHNNMNNIPLNNATGIRIKNNYSNVKYMREQLYSENVSQKKFKVKRGQTGSNFMKRNNYSDIAFKTKNKINLNDINMHNTGYNQNNMQSIVEEENKLKYIRNNNKFLNFNNKSNEYDNKINNLSKINNNISEIYYNLSLEDIEVKVGVLWNRLGVEETFKKTFNKLKEDMESDEAKKEFMIMEIQILENFEKLLKELSSEIEKREKSLLLIKKLNKIIEKQFIDLDLEINEKILKDFYQALIGYRINTIKIVEGFMTYHQLFSYNINKGKFKEDYLIKKYELFGKENQTGNYLLKIKNDLNFLGKSKINGYKQLNLNFGVNSDPFLLNAIYKIPFNLEKYCSRIKQCQYAIMQEVIFNAINPDPNYTYKDNDNDNEKDIYDNEEGKAESGTNNNSYKFNKKDNIKYRYDNSNRYRNNNYQRMREGNRKSEKIMIEAQLIDQKDYERFFNTNIYNDDQSDEKMLVEIRNGFKKMNKKNFKIKTDDNSSKINDKYKKEESKINQIEKSEKKEQNDLIKNNDNDNNNNNENKDDKNKENNINIDKKKKNENIEIIDKRKEPDKMKENKDINENLINIIENKNENENKNEKQNKSNVDSIKDNNIKEHISIDIKESKEKSRSVSPISEKGSKIILTKEMNENQKDNNVNITNDKNNIAIKSIRESDLIEFYIGKLSDFLPLYSSYYNLIPEEQKIIFNIKSDPMQYIYNNFCPKIIIYKDKKSQNIKGLCIFSHIFTNESKNNDLFIEHISSYNDEERETIFEKLLSFIKENSCNIFGLANNKKEKEIYIDLYYKCINGKFSINTDIRDFLRNQMKFKWVKLENSSKLIRYQKMRHQFIVGSGNKIDLLNNEYDDNNVLNESILGRKEFNNDENNKNEEEQESEENELNIDISRILDNDIEKGRNNQDKDIINSEDKNNNTHISKKLNLLNNFTIKNKTVLKFSKEYNDNNKKNNCLINIKYSNPFNFIYLLNKINESENISYNDISTNINNFFSKKDSDIINNITSNCIFEKKTILLETDYYYSDVHELMKENKNKFKINTNINIYPIFDNCISFKYKNYYYNRVQQKKIKSFIDKDTQQNFYMINKTENQILLISSSLNETFKQKYISNENKDNISINFMNIYHNLNDADNIDNNILYIPAFEIKSKLVNNYFINNENNNKYNLYCFEDYYNVKYLTEELKINKNMGKGHNKNINTNFYFDMVKEEDTNKQNFIGDDFLLVILNLNVTEDLRALPLLTLYITKDNFISDENITIKVSGNN